MFQPANLIEIHVLQIADLARHFGRLRADRGGPRRGPCKICKIFDVGLRAMTLPMATAPGEQDHLVERPAHDDGTLKGALDLLAMDACRWVRPEEVADRSEVPPLTIAKMLYRHPPLRAMAWFRLATLMHRRNVKVLPSILRRRLLRLYGLELVPGARIGGGLYIAHPVGCVIVVESMGANVSLMGSVTFGRRKELRWPVVHDGAFFGAGCRVLGAVEIGARAVIGANAVVLTDVPADAVAVGIPARVLPR